MFSRHKANLRTIRRNARVRIRRTFNNADMIQNIGSISPKKNNMNNVYLISHRMLERKRKNAIRYEY